ncbi:hypothetical protein B0H19DRAFT_384253 [Mycena capillaripes]|nr:hypothetical protein B0H19DRAFT_384253 [Mycena capillaripes]
MSMSLSLCYHRTTLHLHFAPSLWCSTSSFPSRRWHTSPRHFSAGTFAGSIPPYWPPGEPPFAFNVQEPTLLFLPRPARPAPFRHISRPSIFSFPNWDVWLSGATLTLAASLLLTPSTNRGGPTLAVAPTLLLDLLIFSLLSDIIDGRGYALGSSLIFVSSAPSAYVALHTRRFLAISALSPAARSVCPHRSLALPYPENQTH